MSATCKSAQGRAGPLGIVRNRALSVPMGAETSADLQSAIEGELRRQLASGIVHSWSPIILLSVYGLAATIVTPMHKRIIAAKPPAKTESGTA